MSITFDFWYSLSFALAGIGGAIFSLRKVRQTNSFLRHATIAKAKVVKLTRLSPEVDSNGDHTQLPPVLHFRDQRGQLIQFDGYSPMGHDVWQLDEVVTIAYDPKSPHDAQVVSYWGLYRMPILAGAGSGFAVVNGLGSLLASIPF